MFADLRYALRRWRARPGFAATAILTLALGVAAATSIFSVVDAVLLKPLPWVDPDALVLVHGVYPARRESPATAPTWNRWYVSHPAWDALQSARSFQAVGTWRYAATASTTFGEARTAIISTMEVSSSFLPMLGVKLSLGRFFNDSEDNVPSDSIMLTDEFWRRELGARPNVIGEHVWMGHASTGDHSTQTVVGVVAPGFSFEGIRPDVLRPIGGPAAVSRQYPSPSLRVVARLVPGASLAAAGAEASAIVSAAPNDQAGSARVVRLEDDHLGSARQPLWLLFGGAAILLLLACSNVAGLLLGEARIRRHEIAVRTAIGGSRARVIRQLVVEHAALAIAGCAAGMALAYGITGALVAIAPEGLPRIDQTVIDVRSVLFASAAGLLTLLVFGVAPALTLARTPVNLVLTDGGRDGRSSRVSGHRLIVAGQVALALVLLTGAALFSETMLKLQAVPLGFEPSGVAVASTTFTGNRFGDPAALKAAFQAAPRGEYRGRTFDRLMTQASVARNSPVLEKLRAIPGAAQVSTASSVPFVTNPVRQTIVLIGRPDTERIEVLDSRVGDGYFATMGIRLLSGRDFDPADAGGINVAIVSSEFERRLLPDGATGRRFKVVYGERYELSTEYQVVGVVASVKRQDPTDDDRPLFYGYHRQGGLQSQFLVRTTGNPSTVLPAMRRAINEVSPQIVVTSTSTLASRVERAVVEERFRATLSAIFGAAALVLATVGLYGLAARRVADRQREFGVRVALGARPGDVRRLVIRDALLIVLVGLAAGVPAAFAAAQTARTLLFGVTTTSPHIFVLAVAVLGTAVSLATILPARLAGRVDPIQALK
jgi:ABC-type antimicrobial peptide transport system permease subunit